MTSIPSQAKDKQDKYPKLTIEIKVQSAVPIKDAFEYIVLRNIFKRLSQLGYLFLNERS